MERTSKLASPPFSERWYLLSAPNGIAPGVVATDALNAALTDEVRAQIVAATPLHRLATIADVASTARWLASPAASYITGKIIEIDGGAEAPVFPHATPDLQPPNKQ